MKNFKKFLTLVLAVMMIVSSVAFSTSAATTKFEDVDADNETLVKAVDLLNYMGVAKGTSEKTFGADELVTRQQFALFIYRLMKGGKDAPANASNSTKFTDLEDPTYMYAIAWANAEGIVNGKSATTFGPKDPIKLQEAYAMIVRALDWEEENDLVYPFGHIEVAEQEGVELDNGLDSKVSYTDELTRGDMAILLYNAFFAETGIEEVDTRERGLGPWELDADGERVYQDYVLEEYTTNPRLCEKAFDVVEVEYKAVATPNYKTGDNEATYDLGYDAIYFVEVTEDDTDAPDEVYIAAEDLGIDAKALNDYFLGEFTMFVTVDEDEIEKVLFADCNMVKKTVTELKLGEVSTNKAYSYFENEDEQTEVKVLSGKLSAGEEEMYVYNAPYTYAGEAYAIGSDAEGKYNTRNSKNLTGIEYSMEKDGETSIYSVDFPALFETEVTAQDYAPTDDDIDAGYIPFAEQAKELIASLYNVYYGGLYEADLLDVDGDGLYDYINYKPYTFFQVDADEEESFEDSEFEAGENGVPYIYTQDATVLGEEFANEDFVIGYFSADLEIVKVAAVVKPTVDTVKKYNEYDGTILLGSGDTVDAVNAWKMIATKEAYDTSDIVYDLEAKTEELVAGNDFFSADILDADEQELYIYNGVLFLYDDVDSNVKFTENLIIPTDVKGVRSSFNSAAGEDTWYVYAWVDGETKYVAVEVEDVYPELIDEEAEELNSEYANKLCTYTVDSNGVYTIKSLGYAEDKNGDYKGIDWIDDAELDDEKDEDIQAYTEIGAANINKVAGSRFEIVSDETLTVEFKSYTKIIVRVEETDRNGDVDYNYYVYDATSFTKTLVTDLTNVSVILGNNVNSSSRENLVLLYAEAEEELVFLGKADKNGYRIVSNSEIAMDEDKNWRYFYELYDPFTGAKVYDVASKTNDESAGELSQAFVPGDIIELVEGMVDDKTVAPEDYEYQYKAQKGVIDTANLLWISEYDAADGYISVVPYDSGITCKDCIEAHMEDAAGDPVTDILGNVLPGNFIDVDKNTVVSVINYSNPDTMWKWGTMSLSSVDALANPKNEVLSYNTKATDKNGNYKTQYADYIKAYVSVDDVEVEDDENPVAEYIIIVVTDKENAALDIVCDNH